MTKNKYLVTGGAGFIGSNIVRKLVSDGSAVRVLDNFSSGKRENLDGILNQIELIDGDIRDYWTVVKAVKGIDVVLHEAALPSVPRSVENPLTSNSVNIDGTLNMLEASRHAGVRRFVIASSSSVYGETEELPKHEKIQPSPLSPYAISKLTNEYYCKVYWDLYKFPTVALRYFNIFGPRQDPKSEYAAVIPRFITCMMKKVQPIVFGDGEQSRDFTYVENCIQANLLAAESDSMVGQAFNVGCGAKFTLNQLLENLRTILHSDIQAQYDPPRQGDIRHSFAAIDKIRKAGYEPTVGFIDGLKKTVEFFVNGQGK
jgi:nucleoside-diphosphate-sugar epimerase